MRQRAAAARARISQKAGEALMGAKTPSLRPRADPDASPQPPERGAFVQGDVLGFIALDLVLRFILAGVVRVAFIIHVFGVHPHNAASDPPRFRIPRDMIADFEALGGAAF